MQSCHHDYCTGKKDATELIDYLIIHNLSIVSSTEAGIFAAVTRHSWILSQLCDQLLINASELNYGC